MLTKGSKLFFVIFFALILGSIATTFYRKSVLRQFEIYTDEAAFSEALIEYFAE